MIYMSDGISRKNYGREVKNSSPASPLVKDCISAFFVGGVICLFGEILFTLFENRGFDEKISATFVSVILIVLTALLTGIGVFDSIAKFAGAGTMVPITGFANSVAAPAIEYTTEGHITGTAVKMFTIAGPVIVYGCSAASLYGFVYYFIGR